MIFQDGNLAIFIKSLKECIYFDLAIPSLAIYPGKMFITAQVRKHVKKNIFMVYIQ